MSQKPKKLTPQQQEKLNNKLGSLYRNIGGWTFFSGLAALLIGLRIDKAYGTQPIFTILLIALTVPLILFINSRVLRKAIARTLAESDQNKQK